MPCDAEKVKYWINPKGKHRIVSPDGRIIPCELKGPELIMSGEGYIPHYVTCLDEDYRNKLKDVLMPCHSCGHEIEKPLILDENQGKYSYRCPYCLTFRGEWMETISEAKKAWNETIDRLR